MDKGRQGRTRNRLGWVGLLCLVSIGVLLSTGSLLRAQERFGGISGVVKDESGGVLPGASVVITNTATGRATTLITDREGAYQATDLEPGRYTVRFELTGFARREVPDVVVLLGRTLDINATLPFGKVTEAVQVTSEPVPMIDVKSATIAHNVTSEELDRLPKPRSFQGIALTAPGVNAGDIEGGFQVNGASGAENAFTVDGVVTNSLIYGSSRQDTVFEYLQEVQVKTSGINAEYGGALGGVISAVTKSGGNAFHGEAHYYYSGNKLSASPVKRLVLNPTDDTTVTNVQDKKQSLNRNEFGGSIGGPIVKDRLFFFGSISPRLNRRTNNYAFSSGTVPGSISQDQTLTQAFGKITLSTGRVNANGSVLMTPTRSTGTLAAYNSIGPNFIVASQTSLQPNVKRGFQIDQTNGGGNVDIWLTKAAYVSVRGGYFSDSYKDTGIPTTTSYTYQASSVGLANVPANLQGPIGTVNTPRALISFFDTTKRAFVQADYNHAFTAGGSHRLKGGVGFQRSTNDVNNSYPGGYVYIYWNKVFTSAFTGISDTGTYGYYRVDDQGTKGKVQGDIVSLYVQDSWTVGSRLTLNLGVRTENEKIPTFRPDIAKYAFNFGFADKLAPRLAATYDLRGDGKVKLFGSWGRYYDWTKYELSRGSFGGDTWHIYYHALDTLDIGSLNVKNLPGRDLWGSPTGFRDYRATYINNIDPSVKPMFQDSTNAGVEFQVNPTTALDVYYVHNQLGRTIEDYSALVGGDSVYQIGNPGEGLAKTYPASYPATKDFPFPKAKRQYDALNLSLSRRFSQNWFASASYTYSRLYGNYAGLANSDEISTPTTGVSSQTAQQSGGSIARPGSNASIAFDIDQLLYDSKGKLDVLGRLATDRPHVVKLYGAYSFPSGTQVGAFFYGGSGTPISTEVISLDAYSPLVNGRGDMGRTPFLTRTDLLVSHEMKVGTSQKLRFELNVINLFNQKTVTHIFNFLNKGAPGGGSYRPSDAMDLSAVNLAKGYDYRALVLASPDGASAFDPRYGKPDLWQAGTQGQFSIKFIF